MTRTTFPSGVPGFDQLLGGGIPKNQSILITGEPGSGKTVLASQIAFDAARRGERVILATTTSESQGKLLEDLAGFDFFTRERLGEELFFLSVYSWLKKGARDAREVLLSTVRERRAKLLVVDGLRTVRDLWQDEAKMREFFYELSVGLNANECTGIFLTEYPLAQVMSYPESTTVDGVISLSNEPERGSRSRRAEVVKLRGMKHLPGSHSMRIEQGGVRIFPRLESITGPDAGRQGLVERAPFGLKELDGLTCGGLPRNTSSLLTGGTGVGKTLLALHFANAGAVAGENSLFISFAESEENLLQRAQRVSLDLTPNLRSGKLAIQFDPWFGVDADEVVHRVLERVDRQQIRRLVFEEIDFLELRLGSRERAQSFFSALVIQLRSRGVTTVFTRKIAKVVGPELDFSDTALAGIAENLIFLRHVELRGKIHRVLSVLNLRDSPFEPTVREFEIRNSGVHVLAPMSSVEGLLTGQARPVGTQAREGSQA
ncbi:MAG: RAD55 family ATPase [Myxococcaceae bacterium]